MKKLAGILFIITVFLASVQGIFAETGINRKINFQGKVVNKGVGVTDGTNVSNGNYDFQFTLWNTLSSGTSIWTESWVGTSQVAVTSGIFVVALGTISTFPPTVDFNNPSLYLSVNYNSDGDMSPRIQMAAVPYAFNAEKVNGLTVTNSTGTLTVPNGNTITFGGDFTTMGVGISLNQNLNTLAMPTFAGLSIGGSVSVSTGLSVGGTVSFTNIPIGTGTTILYINSSGNLVQGTLPTGGTTYTFANGLTDPGTHVVGLGGSLTADTQIGMSSYSFSYFGLGGTQSLFIGATGYVGIGTSNPLGPLHVKIGGTEAIFIKSDGSVGIGTPGPATKLDVNGMLTVGSTGGAGATNSKINSGYNVYNKIDLGSAGFALTSYLSVKFSLDDDNSDSSETFRIATNGGTKDLLYLTGESGNLGVGTTDPLYKLQVVGDVMVGNRLGVGATGMTAFNVSTDMAVGTNLTVGGSLSMTAIPEGVGTSVLYISSTGVVTKGTLPVTGVANNKTMVLSAEYAGASLSADGSGTTSVSMTSDNTLNAGGVGWKNYYELSSTNAALQDYTVIVRVTLPSDYGSWQTGTCPGANCALEFAYQTGVGTTDDNNISFKVNNDSDTPASAVCSIGATANTSWGLSGCTSAVLGGTPAWKIAGQTAVIRIKMAAKTTASALTRAGDITLRYISAF
jgi:hypothetical protein